MQALLSEVIDQLLCLFEGVSQFEERFSSNAVLAGSLVERLDLSPTLPEISKVWAIWAAKRGVSSVSTFRVSL